MMLTSDEINTIHDALNDAYFYANNVMPKVDELPQFRLNLRNKIAHAKEIIHKHWRSE